MQFFQIHELLANSILLSKEKFNVHFYEAVQSFSTTFAESTLIFETLCAIWYHLHNSENVKNSYEGVLHLVK